MSRLHQGLLYISTTSNERLPALSFGQPSTDKPGLSFPLGTGLVVVIILFVSALFSFCYHWLRLRKTGTSMLDLLQPSAPQSAPAAQATIDICKAPTKLDMLQCPPVVYMAGEDMPRFIAVPCAFEGSSCKAIAEDAHENSVHKSLDAIMLDIRL